MGAAIAEELRVYARKRWPLTTDEWRKDRLAALLGFSRRRVKSLYEGERTAVPRKEETDAVERLIGKRIGEPAIEEEAQNGIEQSRAEYRALEARIARIEALFAGADAKLSGPELDEIRALARGKGAGAARSGRANGRTDRSPRKG